MQSRPGAHALPDAAARLHRVFVRAGVLTLRRPSDAPGRDAPRAPDADRALETLRAFGHEVVIVSDDAATVDLAPRDWLLTDQPDDCRWARRAGARTVLVGAVASDVALQPDRCDLIVGSVQGAAMEVVIGEPEREAADA